MDIQNKNTDQNASNYLQTWCLLLNTWYVVFRLRNAELSRFNLTVGKTAILNILRYNNGWATSKDVESATQRKHNTVSVLVNKMIKSGLLYKEKRPDETSHRIIQTAASKDLFSRITTDSIENSLAVLSHGEKESLHRSLLTITAKARDLTGTSYVPPFMEEVAPTLAELASRDRHADDYISDYDLWTTLDGAVFAIHRLRQMELKQYGITVEKSLILNSIIHEGGRTMIRGLENLTLRNHNSISAIVNRLVRSGLVEKRKERNKRTYLISLTHRGEQLARKLPAASIDMVFSYLPPEDINQMVKSLRSVYSQSRESLTKSQVKSVLSTRLSDNRIYNQA